MQVIRAADSVYLQYIWNAIEANEASRATFNDILSAVTSNYDPKCNASKLQKELSNAVSDGCVQNVLGHYSLVDGFETFSKGRSDWYCFECHGAGPVVSCPTCFRVYHTDCLAAACETHWSCRLPTEDPTVGTAATPDVRDTPPEHPCPVCKRLTRVNDNLTSVQDLQTIFATALECIRSRVPWRTMQKVGYLYEPLRNRYLVYQQINTRVIGDRLRIDPLSPDGYANRTQLLIDLDNLVHNASVFYGSKHVISNMARQIRSQLKRAMRESTYCVSCYLRPSTMPSGARITAACRTPHRLLWFQHNGWSFRPCKLLYESTEGYEVVCFGGRHEREFVPRARAFDMTFSAPELGLRMTPSLKRALNETEEYKANQSALDRSKPVSSITATIRTNLLTPTTLGVNERQLSASPYQTLVSHNTTPNSKSPIDTQSIAASRKRKAGPKYLSAFGSTDTESTTSALSSTATGNSKRRKSVPTVSSSTASTLTSRNSDVGHMKINRGTKERIERANAEINRSIDSDSHSSSPSSSLDSDTDCDQKQAFSRSSETSFNRTSITHTTRTSRGAFNSTMATPMDVHSNPPINTPTLPVLRIKPMPPLSDDTPPPALSSNHRSTRSKPSSPQSGLSSTATTISATAGDPPALSESSFPTTSSHSRFRNRTKRPPGRPPKSHPSSVSTEPSVVTDRPRSTRVKTRSHAPPPHLTTTIQLNRTMTIVRREVTKRSSSPLSHRSSTLAHSRSPSPTSSELSTTSSSTSLSSSSSASSSPSSESSSLSSSTTTSSTSSPTTRRATFGTVFSGMGKASTLNNTTTTNSCETSCLATGQATMVKHLTVTAQPMHNSDPTRNSSPSSSHRVDQSSVFGGQADVSGKMIGRQSLSSTASNGRTIEVNPTPVGDAVDALVGATTMVPNLGHRSAERIAKQSKKYYSDRSQHPLSDFVTDNSPRRLPTVPVPCHQHSLTSNKVPNVGGWSSNRPYGSHTPIGQTHTTATNNSQGSCTTSTGPTPPSCSSSSSSCYSSVSPAALSTTSGLGSSLSDPKSVDASPAEVNTLLLLGNNASFSSSSCGSSTSAFLANNHGGGGGSSSGPSSTLQSDLGLFKTGSSVEDHLHRIYAERLASLELERDQAREELLRRDALVDKLSSDHEAELKRVKQLTWCQVCLNQAFYHCCPGTAYCSEGCQLQHWTEQHNRDCRRRGESQQLVQQPR